MRKRHGTMVLAAVLILILSALACNAPTSETRPTDGRPAPTITPFPAATATNTPPRPTKSKPEARPDASDTETPEVTVEQPTEATETSKPAPTRKPETEEPSSEPTGGPTDEPTETSEPTETGEVTGTQEATMAPPGPPLTIGDPGYEIADWQKLEDAGEWEGHLRVIFSGGVEPYQFALENRPPQDENLLEIRWRKCRDAPLTVHVWSADGQEAHKSVWVISPWCDEESE